MQAKKRQWDAEDVVLPALREARPQVIEAVRSEMAKNRVTGTKEQLQMAFSKRVEGVVRFLSGMTVRLDSNA